MRCKPTSALRLDARPYRLICAYGVWIARPALKDGPTPLRGKPPEGGCSGSSRIRCGISLPACLAGVYLALRPEQARYIMASSLQQNGRMSANEHVPFVLPEEFG